MPLRHSELLSFSFLNQNSNKVTGIEEEAKQRFQSRGFWLGGSMW